MNIGFDAKRLFLNYTGLGNYSRFIVNGLIKNETNNNYFLFSPRIKKNSETVSYFNNEKVEIIMPSFPFSVAPLSNIWRSYAVTKEHTFKNLDVFHGLSHELPINIDRRIRKIVTIHDLIFLRYPQFYGAINASIYKSKVTYACHQADKIIAISESTKSDLIEYLGVKENKIDVVYQGCHPQFGEVQSQHKLEEVSRKYNLPKKFILFVGTIEERKNLLVIIKSLALISPENRPYLVVIGKKTSYFNKVEQFINENILTNYVHILSNADFSDFPAIYQQASLFVYPSLFEGFGIPIVEAIQSNVPVITSKGSCFSEAGGPNASYIDPHNEHVLAEIITTTLSQDQQERISLQKEHIRQFDNSIIAKKIMEIYNH
jgi:glycosyltransferase involved in cell wall biosynthesis